MTILRPLLERLIDYAGLFPPALLPMAHAVDDFAAYRQGEFAWMLGRFVVPAARIPELEEAAHGLLPEPGQAPWQLSVLGGTDGNGTREVLEDLRRRHPEGELAAPAVEMKASTPADAEALLRALPAPLEVFVEVPWEDPEPLIAALAGSHGRAKFRTGGITPEAFPSTAQLASFLAACHRHGVAFKATAGLHHPLTGGYRLTYQPESPRGTMFGFLNVFIGSLLLGAGRLGEDDLLRLLDDGDPSRFHFTADGLGWQGETLGWEQVAQARGRFALSYGSCSFVEPLEDLQRLNLL
jgi:hypothetical protein